MAKLFDVLLLMVVDAAVLALVGITILLLQRAFPSLDRPVPGSVTVKLGSRRLPLPLGAALIFALVCGLFVLTWWLIYGR